MFLSISLLFFGKTAQFVLRNSDVRVNFVDFMVHIVIYDFDVNFDYSHRMPQLNLNPARFKLLDKLLH